MKALFKSAILVAVKNESLQAGISFADALYCICILKKKTGHVITAVVLVVLIRRLVNVKTSEEQAKDEQEERKRSFNSSWQSKKGWFLCVF